MKNILVIAPHPDDEILGCGGTIRKKIKNGCNVIIIIMTNANKSIPERYTLDKLHIIREEAKSAHEILGIKETIFKDFPAPMLDQFPIYLIAETINAVLNEKEIDTVYLPHRGDIHNDHKVIFDAAMVACRPISNYCVKNIYAYETLSETEWAHPFASDVFIPTYYETLEYEMLHSKCKAMKCYSSQLRQFPSSRSIIAIEALAKYRGSAVSSELAEAFMIIRMIN